MVVTGHGDFSDSEDTVTNYGPGLMLGGFAATTGIWQWALASKKFASALAFELSLSKLAKIF